MKGGSKEKTLQLLYKIRAAFWIVDYPQKTQGKSASTHASNSSASHIKHQVNIKSDGTKQINKQPNNISGKSILPSSLHSTTLQNLVKACEFYASTFVIHFRDSVLLRFSQTKIH